MTIGFPRSALHLGGLWALAAVQPLFALLGDNAQFFVARGSPAGDILLFAVVWTVVPPLVLAFAVWAAGRVRPAVGWWLHVGIVGALVALLVLAPAGEALSGSTAAVGVAAAVGAAAAWAYARAAPVRSVVAVLSPAPLIVLGLFLLVSPVAVLLRPGDGASALTGPTRSSTPIVQVVLDELPVTTITGADGRIDGALFPNLARLARDATWYRNATTVADSTPEAIPALLTGRLPRRGELPIVRDHPDSLFTLFGRSHDLAVAEPITDICPDRLCAETRPGLGTRMRALAADVRVVLGHTLLPAGLTRGLPPIDESWEGFGATEDEPALDEDPSTERSELIGGVVDRLRADDARAAFARAELALERRGSRPPLLFVHSTLPHAPWRYLPDGRRYDIRRSVVPGFEEPWPRRRWLVDQTFRRHVLQVQEADRLLGGLLDRLEATGVYDDAVVVVSADHGAAFEPGEPRRVLTDATAAEIAAVPLLVKLPHQRAGRADDRAVRTVDVLPTIAAAAGVRVPWRADGVAADRRPSSPSTPVRVFSGRREGFEGPLSVVLAGVRAREAHERGLFAHGVDGIGASRPELLGRSVARLVVRGTGARGGTATVDGARGYRAIRRGAVLVPAMVAGTVRGVRPDAPLAVAVDGRVRATTRVFRAGDGLGQFSTLVPASALPPGPHEVEVYAVLAGDRLRRLGGTAAA